MSDKLVDVTLHIDENTSHEEREALRDVILGLHGVSAAAYHDERPHLMVVSYDPEAVNSGDFLSAAKTRNLHAELIGL